MAESKESYMVHAESVPELSRVLNFHMSGIADRLDALEGHRDRPTFYQNPKLEAAEALGMLGTDADKIIETQFIESPSDEAKDHGVPDAVERTLKNMVDEIGLSKKATITLAHTGDGNTTLYTLATSLTIPSNIALVIENGAIIDGAGTLTINGPFNAGLYQCFGSSVTIAGLKKVHPHWWGTDRTAIQAAIDVVDGASGIGVIDFAGGNYVVTGSLKIESGDIVLDLRGTTITSSGSFPGGQADESAVINIRGSGSQCENVAVLGGRIVGPASAGEAWGVHVSWAKNVLIDGVHASGSSDAGIRVDGYGSAWGNEAHIGTLDEGYTSYVSVINCHAEESTGGAGIELIADPTHCIVIGNTCDTNVVNGLRVAYASFSIISDNIIQDTGLNSKSLYVGGRSLIVTDNFISGKNSSGSGLIVGIYLAVSVIDSLIENNIIRDVNGEGVDGFTDDDGTHVLQNTTIRGNKIIDWGDTSEWGIIIRGTDSDDNIVENNILSGTVATTRGINVQAGTGRAPKRCIVRDNVIQAPSTLLLVSGRSNKSYRNIDYTSQRTIDGDAFGPDDYPDSGVPTSGTFEQRDRIWTDPPSLGVAMGYVCTQAGTNGTLAGVTGSIDNGSAILTVNDASDLEVRDRITVVGVSGIKSIKTISGTTVTLSVVSDATVAGAAVAYSTAIFKAMASLREKAHITAIGGFAVKLTNETGFNTIAGQLVKADTAANDAVVLAGIGDVECFGVFLDTGIADGAEAWVVVSGIADVAFDDDVAAVRGNWVATGAAAGYASTQASPAAAPTHFEEIGHCVESVAAGGGGTHILARCVLHFN